MSNIFTQIKPHFLSSSSTALTGGKLFIYTAGTTTKASLFSDKLLSSAIANPVILNSRGEPTSDGSTACSVWIADGVYKYVIAPATDTDPPTSPIDTVDNIPLSSSTFYDSNGNVVLSLITAAAAVNYVTITDASTGNSPIIATAGNDTNIGVKLQGKGTGAVILGQATGTVTVGADATTAATINSSKITLAADQPIADSSGNTYLAFSKTASAVNALKITNTATGNNPILQATGEANKGVIIKDSNGTAALTINSVASSVNGLKITETATGSAPILSVTGDVNRGLIIADSNNAAAITVASTASAVNAITVTNQITTVAPVVQATGSDSNISLSLKGSGTSGVTAGTPTGTVPMIWQPGSTVNTISHSVPTITAARTVTWPDASLTIPSITGKPITQVVRQTFTANGTYTPTTGMTYCDVEAVGAGGGGGGCANSGASSCTTAAGGGGGETLRKLYAAATIGVSQTITIGTAGTAGASGGGAGGTGGNTTFGALLTAHGGTGGATGSTSTSVGGTGGAGGTADVVIPGEDGGSICVTTASGNIITMSGRGGSSHLGNGGKPTISNGGAGAGQAGTGYGGGGGGSCTANAAGAAAGGAGAAGYVCVTEYLSV